MQTVTFYAYKGGTGRSLALANTARYLARLGLKVFVIDLDLEAPGLHYKLRPSGEGSVATIERGIVDIIHSFAKHDSIPDRFSPYTIDVSEGEGGGRIILMPAGNVLSSSYWKRLSDLNWHDLFYTEGAEGVPFFLELKETIRAEFAPDFLLIDARTGITEIGGVATTLLPDLVVCFLLSNPENLEGAREVLRSISRVSSNRNDPIRIVPVLSRIPFYRRLDESDRKAATKAEIAGCKAKIARIRYEGEYSGPLGHREKDLAESVREFLNERAEDQQVSVDLPFVLIMHAEEALAIRETLFVRGSKSRDYALAMKKHLIGGSTSLDDIPLVRDYVRLFSQIIPSDQVEARLDRLIETAMKEVVEKPNKVQETLEFLANFCPHPKSYLALLKCYRLRNASSFKVLRTALHYWKLSGQSDHPILWEIVRDHFWPDKMVLKSSFDPFKEETTFKSGRLNRRYHPEFLSKMVEAVWIASGTDDPVAGAAQRLVGFGLADLFFKIERQEKAFATIERMLNMFASDEKFVIVCFTKVIEAREYKEYQGYDERASFEERAKSMLSRWAPESSAGVDLQMAWASVIAVLGDVEGAKRLLDAKDFGANVQAKKPELYRQLLALAGRQAESLPLTSS